jgi:tRNA U34 5-carboxymethylaminomethyl modifying enzyme MnmG/GidA
VLNTEGSYGFSVDLTTLITQDPSIGTLPVKPSVAGVSNAEVLKSIVALIASINKQIQALQKLILQRK